MPKITRISAGKSGSRATAKPEQSRPSEHSPMAKSPKSVEKTPNLAAKKPRPALYKSKPLHIVTWPFRMIFKPFAALGHYIKDSWQELRQVRWPSRKATWKMTGTVLVYTALLMTFIVLLDTLFTFIFNQLFKK